MQQIGTHHSAGIQNEIPRKNFAGSVALVPHKYDEQHLHEEGYDGLQDQLSVGDWIILPEFNKGYAVDIFFQL